jgi:hypothetical protein
VLFAFARLASPDVLVAACTEAVRCYKLVTNSVMELWSYVRPKFAHDDVVIAGNEVLVYNSLIDERIPHRERGHTRRIEVLDLQTGAFKRSFDLTCELMMFGPAKRNRHLAYDPFTSSMVILEADKITFTDLEGVKKGFIRIPAEHTVHTSQVCIGFDGKIYVSCPQQFVTLVY